MKKIFIISSVLLFAILFFFGIYSFVFRSPVVPEKAVVEVQPTPVPPVKEEENADKIAALTDEPVVAYVVEEDTDAILYYSGVNGNTVEISLDGKDKAVRSRDVLQDIHDAYWSPQKNKVISHFRTAEGDSFYYYNNENKLGVKLKSGLDSVAWTNLGDKIIYKYYDSADGKRSLNIADPDGTNWKMLTEVKWRNLKIAQIPQTSLISFWNAPSSQEETDFQTISLAGGAPTTLLKGKFGADYLWAPDGQHFLTSFLEEKGGNAPALYVTEEDGKNMRNLGIPTFVSKTVWSEDGKTIYYAIPGAVGGGTVPFDDYVSGKVMTRDTFWKVDINTGKKDRLVELADIKESFDATDLSLSEDEGVLFFVNRADKKIYRINLEK